MSTLKKEKYNGVDVFTAISLCSGYEGLGLGLRRAIPNIRTICYVENECYAIANLVAKIKEGKLDDAPIWDDIKTFDPKPFAGMVDIIHSGYPCQPFSVAGKRQGTDDSRHLWPHIERILEAVRPIWFFGENVSEHLTIGFPEVYRSLRNLGYKVEAGLFSAAEVSAPHKRERLFILAHAEHNGHFSRKRPRSIGSSVCDTKKGQDGSRNSQGTSKSSKLANTKCNRRREICIEENRKSAQQLIISESQKGRIRWPARPGQPQYEWEEPRVVDNTLFRRHKPKKEQIQTRGDGVEQTNKGQAQSRLGRAADGTSCRVDRLRLLDNGVVPQQAEKAFKYLIEKF